MDQYIFLSIDQDEFNNPEHQILDRIYNSIFQILFDDNILNTIMMNWTQILGNVFARITKREP